MVCICAIFHGIRWLDVVTSVSRFILFLIFCERYQRYASEMEIGFSRHLYSHCHYSVGSLPCKT
jgi:hypothetical protein